MVYLSMIYSDLLRNKRHRHVCIPHLVSEHLVIKFEGWVLISLRKVYIHQVISRLNVFKKLHLN
jgi:hypothetical protein